jgi:hypothetical protein
MFRCPDDRKLSSRWRRKTSAHARLNLTINNLASDQV